MTEITDLILSYRECARHVWNCHFQKLPEGWHEFINVDDHLLYGIVLVQTDEAKDWRAERKANGCYPSIRVKPNFGPKGMQGMWARKQDKNSWKWDIIQITDSEIGLSFISFFDWNPDGYQDYGHIRCRIHQSQARPDLIGADLLLPALQVMVHYEKQT